MQRPRSRPARRWPIVLAIALALPTLWWFGTGRPMAYGALTGARVESDSVVAGVRYEGIVLATSSGRSLRCLVRSPAGPTTGVPGPALLVAGGQGAGRRAVRYLGSAFAGSAIACDYTWAPRVRRSWPLIAWAIPRIRAELLATPEALAVAAAYLRTRPDVDPAKIAAVGASLGVPPVAAWASRDTLPRAVALLYGGGRIDRQIDIVVQGHLWPWLSRLLGSIAGRMLADLEPTRTVPGIAPRPVLVIGARDDQRVPAEEVQALFDAAGEPRRIIWLSGTHLRGARDEQLLRTLADSSLVWLAEVVPANWVEPPK